MKNTSKCNACGKEFTLDFRNLDRQLFCSRQACQRQRRAFDQRLCRRNAQPTIQAASAIAEADM